MPLSFLWALPDSWCCKNTLQTNHNLSRLTAPALLPLAATARVPSRAVTPFGSRTLAAAVIVDADQLSSSSNTFSVRDGVQDASCSPETRSNEQQLRNRSHNPRTPTTVRRGGVSSRHEVKTDHASKHASISLSQQTSAQKKQRSACQAYGAVLTRQISSAQDPAQLLDVLKAHQANINSIHVTAGYKMLVTFHQQQQITFRSAHQDEHRSVTAELLRLAAQHSSSLTPSERSYILWGITELQLHPWHRWYRVILGPGEDTQQPQELAAGGIAAATDGSHNSSCTSSLPGVGVDSKLLSRLISHAATLAELKAILQPCWSAVTAGHAAEVLQQLMLLQQPRTKSNRSDNHQACRQQPSRVQLFAQQLLQHAVAGLALPAAATPAATLSTAVVGRAACPAAVLTGCQASAVVRVLEALELQVDQQQLRILLQQLLRLVEADALRLTGSAVVDLLTGLHGLLQQQQQQMNPSQQQQQQQINPQQPMAMPNESLGRQGLSAPGITPSLQRPKQQQHQDQSPKQQQQPQPQLKPLQVSRLPQGSSSEASALEGDEARELMEQRRVLLLHQQQQEEQLHQQEKQRRQQQQQAALAAVSIQEQQRRQHVQILSLLSSILAKCCRDLSSKLRQDGLLSHHLAAILKALHALKYVPSGGVLLQLIAAADLCHSDNSNSTSALGGGSVPQQHHHQQQQQRGLRAGDAAAVLWQLAQLADLEQQQQLVVVPAPAELDHRSVCSTDNLRKDSSSNWLVLSTLQQTQVLPVLLDIVMAKSLQPVAASMATPSSATATSYSHVHGSPAVGAHTLCVTLAALAKIADAAGAAEAAARSAAAAVAAPGATVLPQQLASRGEDMAAARVSAAGLVGLGVSPNHIQPLMDRLLELAEQQGQQQSPRQALQHLQKRQQQQQRWLHKNESESALDNVIKLWQHLVQHSPELVSSTQQQHSRQLEPQQPQHHDIIGPEQQHQQQQRGVPKQGYTAQWVQRYATAILPQMKIFSPERLTHVLLLLSNQTLEIQQLPDYWLDAVEARVLYHIQVLCGSSSGDNHREEGCRPSSGKSRPDAAAKLLHGWVTLVLQLQQRQWRRRALSKHSRSTAAPAANEGVPLHSSHHAAGNTQGFANQAAAALQPHLVHLDPQSLGLAAWAIGSLELTHPGPWLQELLPTITATVSTALVGGVSRIRGSSSSTIGHLAATSMLAVPLPAAAAYGVPAAVAATVPATSGTADAIIRPTTAPTAAAGHAASTGNSAAASLTPQALLHLLQSLLLLRCRPPIPLLQQALALAQRDMLAVAKGSVLVGLLLVLVQLRVRPSTGWMRAMLLRIQGKLRMLSFDELTQTCWCLAQMGVVPPQQWQDDFADIAAVHVTARRRQQQQRKQKQQKQYDEQHMSQTAAALSPSTSSTNTSRGTGMADDSKSSLAAAAAHAAVAKAPADHVHTWQLMVMHWAFACWGYRPGHAVGKLQYRLLRELNTLAWGVHAQQLQGQEYLQKQQQGVKLPMKQQHRLQVLVLTRKVRKQRHVQLQLLRYYRRRRMSSSWQVAAAATRDAANRWAKKRKAAANAAHSTSARSADGYQSKQVQEQQPQRRLPGWRQLLWRRQSGAAGVRRDAERLLERLMQRRAAAVWPKQWGLIALEPQPVVQ